MNIDTGGEIYLSLTWNDWPRTDIDLDLFLYDGDGNLLASSRNQQTGNQPPTELLRYPSPRAGNYRLRVSGPDNLGQLKAEVFSLNHQLEHPVKRGSIMAPGNVEEVFTVGAIDIKNWEEGEIEPFSSRGPTSDGRIKPDIAGIDGATTYIYRKFLGTSAAAPNMGGAAALILSRSPDLSPKQLKRALTKHAKDLGIAGEDNTYGKGQIRLLFNAPSAMRSLKDGSNRVSPGEEFTVELVAKMPLTLQGGIEVEERVPPPLKITEVTKPDSYTKPEGGKVKFDWPIVPSGSKRIATYKVYVPEDIEPGSYEIEGEINGKEMDSTEVIVSSSESVSQNQNSGLDLEEVSTTEAASAFAGIKFETQGINISQIRVTVYNLSGRRVYDSNWRQGETFQWNLMNDRGGSVPNGVYLYVVSVKGTSGEIEKSETEKVLVLR
ncbi:MAG: S8 family serine peptidase [Candidatus Bipolaricaulia bacterium]